MRGGIPSEGGIAVRNEDYLKIDELQREGHGYKKIAALLDLPLNTVKSYIRRHPVTKEPTKVVSGCLHCGAPLIQNTGKKEKKFCSDRCRMAWWNTHPERVNKKAFYTATCAHCGREFVSYGNKGRKYCSRPCFDNSRRKGGKVDE